MKATMLPMPITAVHYVANPARKSTFNTVDQVVGATANSAQQINNLLSDTNETYNLYKPFDITGLTATAVVPSTNFRATDLEINQAIEAAQ
jgi:hypothetical protein